MFSEYLKWSTPKITLCLFLYTAATLACSRLRDSGPCDLLWSKRNLYRRTMGVNIWFKTRGDWDWDFLTLGSFTANECWTPTHWKNLKAVYTGSASLSNIGIRYSFARQKSSGFTFCIRRLKRLMYEGFVSSLLFASLGSIWFVGLIYN